MSNMMKLEKVGFKYSNVPTGICFENDKGILVFYEDKKITIVPPIKKNRNGDLFIHANFTLDEIEAIYNQAIILYGKSQKIGSKKENSYEKKRNFY